MKWKRNNMHLRISLRKLLCLIVFLSVVFVLVNFLGSHFISDVLFKPGIYREDSGEQSNYIAEYLDVRWTLKENLHKFAKHELVLTNKGQNPIWNYNWKIYFHHNRIIEPIKEWVDDRYTHDVLLGDSGLRVTHVFGLLYYIYPDKKLFNSIKPYQTLKIPITTSHFQLSRFDVFPNWYVVSSGSEPKIIQSTAGESLDFVSSFNQPQQWKRSENDKHNPYTAFDRYNLSIDTMDLKRPGKLIIPTPEVMVILSSQPLKFKPSDWSVMLSDDFPSEVNFLSEKLGVKISSKDIDKRVIKLTLGNPTFSQGADHIDEAYELRVGDDNVIIIASSSHGIFNGVQSLINLVDISSNEKTIPRVHLKDRPRFGYRGYMVDVSRNFHPKETILNLLDMMAMYKLNKFHFHLSDDDGWRLEIPGIPQLTQLGSNRCHDESETNCLYPSLGSGPFKNQLGSGYYSIKDYKEILKYANQRHIQVIPEIDMPSHMRAAIKSLILRHVRSGNKSDPYKMTDSEDGNNYRSAQGFNDNSANPCREGLYTFLNKILDTLIKAHEDIQPLTLYHFGGDEVPKRAVKDMKCSTNKKDIKQHFVERVVSNTKYDNLNYGAWEDGLLEEDKSPYPLDRVRQNKNDLYAFVWTEHNKALFKMANAGYKVINCRGAFLYFDHPYEPDPEERGLYWATRYINTRMVFEFNPLKGKEGYGQLNKPENIIGMQGQLWTELIRTSDQFQYMTYPRLQALAERAWHRASWESDGNKAAMERDWIDFANTIGYKEFPKMDKLKVEYRLPPPGAILKDDKLIINLVFPGLTVEYSKPGQDRHWTVVKDGETVTDDIILRTRSPHGKRYSREVLLKSTKK